MPIYEFLCSSCDYEFELLLMRSDEMNDVRCPKCQSPDVGKKMSRPNIATSAAPSGGKDGRAQTGVQQRSCDSGTCTTITLPGHTR